MHLTDDLAAALAALMNKAASGTLTAEDYGDMCRVLRVEKLYYDIDLGDSGRYLDKDTEIPVFADDTQENKIILYDSGRETGVRLVYPYYYGELEYVHAFSEFAADIPEEEIDKDLIRMMADIVYIIASRQNMRRMLDFAEMTDAQTGIANTVAIAKYFAEVTKRIPAKEYYVLFINLQNFKYINEVSGARSGDEAIVKYARTVSGYMGQDEGVCRMGGDNFGMFIKRANLTNVLKKLESVSLGHLKSAPGRTFEVSAWVGITECGEFDHRPFSAHISEASIACNIGKNRLKRNVVFYSEELKLMMNRGREILAMFRPAIRNREFRPFFQAKVDMRTGELVGFEALCRWLHDGRFIYPDQFIPILDKEGLIYDLDMAIFRETCACIRKWHDMGLHPPRISSNFSRKNLFVPDIEKNIYSVIEENGIDVGDVEIEITESVKEAETDRLIDFVKNLKSYGLHISIDDFGTGYSSLMLIHNIDADVIKIDKSFVDNIPGERKSVVLIESIISIAHNLGMSLIAEGVETAEQGRELLRLGCHNAQGYYYSKPVEYETATRIIKDPDFKAIILDS